MKTHLSLVQGLPLTGDVPIPLPACLPLPQPDDAMRAHLSIPAGVSLKAWSREHDAAVWIAAPGTCFRGAYLQAGGCTAPLQPQHVDMACALVVEISIGNLPMNSAKRIVSMMPFPFAFHRGV